MTQNRKIRKLCFVSAGMATVALGASAWFAADNGIVVGQTPSAQDVAALPNAAPGPGAIDPSAQNLPAPGAAASASDSIPALRARLDQLRASLQNVPTSAEEQIAQQKTITEISNLQAQIQRLETTAGQYSAYRQARDAQAGLGDPNAALTAPTTRQGALDASGLSSPYLSDRVGGGAALTQSDASLLREQKEGLTQQYRQIQQTLRALQPGDEALAENLRQEQETLLSQLRDIDARLMNAPAPAPAATAAAQPDFVVPQANQLNFNTVPTDNIMEKLQKANQAAQLLREAGLFQLAGHVTNEIPRMSAPNFTETNLVEGTWSQGANQADEASNPFHTVSPKDIQGINDSIGALKTQIESLSQKLSDVETQLKLLTRQQVSGYIQPSQDAAAPQPQFDDANAVPADADAPTTDVPDATAPTLPAPSATVPAAPGDLSDDSLGLGEFKALSEEDYRALKL